MEHGYDYWLQLLRTQGSRLLGGLVVLAAGLFISHWLIRFFRRSQRLKRIDPTLKSFLDGFIKVVLYVLVALTAVNVMGVPMTSVVALLASAGVAVSLAMQGALGNFIGGVMLLTFKQIKVGEYVKVGDVEGTVRSIGVLYTELITFDNRHVTLPNSNLTNTAIINFSREGTRRLDVNFGVGYASDIERTKAVLADVIRGTGGILPDPAPGVYLTACGDSSLTFTLRVWTTVGDYWNVLYALLENGKRALDAAGIEIPYPQMDVHIKDR